MSEFFNFNNTWIIVQHNWIWLLIALLVGCFVGWRFSGAQK